MHIKDNFRKLIVDEIKYVVEKMDSTSSGEEKLYYFSAISGILQRIYNLEFDSDLLYAHFILQETHSALLGRLKAIEKGAESIITVHEYHFERLTSILEDLGEKIAENKALDNTLKKLVLLIYTTTGNGYYLQQKGLLKI
jgi:hypothetical protein